jgi:hypothetical protein
LEGELLNYMEWIGRPTRYNVTVTNF